MAWGALLALAGLGLATASGTGCGQGGDGKDYFVVQLDAGADAEEGGARDAEAELDPTLGGPCTDDAQCDDLVPCTFDRCDQALSRCRNTPDDALCADAEFCNGRERCVLRQGCVPGPVEACDDKNGCTIDRCVDATRSCEHLPRDADGDGDPDGHCSANGDCDDTDPTVSSQRAEICGNFKDDDCDGEIDEEPCATAAHDVCAAALAIDAPGTFLLATTAAVKDYTTSCTVPTPAAARDIVLAITVPAGGAKDVHVRARTSTPQNPVAVALEATCGDAGTELACAYLPGLGEARTIARSVASGTTIFAVITTQMESEVEVTVDLLAGTTRPGNETCAAPQAIALDAPFTVSLVDPAKDLASDCTAKTGELTYAFTLTEPRDVRVFASTLLGSGDPVLSIRAPGCADELRCRVGSSPPVFARSLPAGTHVLAVAGTGQIDASIVVKTYAPTPVPPDQTCATAPTLPHDTPLAVNLDGHEDAIKDGCFPGGPNAAYALELAQASDVLLIGRFASSDYGAVSLDLPACGPDDLLACSTGSTPQRVSRRKLAAGSYRAVIGDYAGLPAQLTALVRPTLPPVTVTSDDCLSAQSIPETGGFFTGDTSGAGAHFNAGCDEPGQPFGGAKDQVLRMALTQKRRVVFDMSGSSMRTLLVVRSGAQCPGVEVPAGCSRGIGSPNGSFLDLTLDAGTYWVQVDGYGGAAGPWNLDVRVLPP